ncbi:MAG: hypothetical protein A2X49_00650 [Lentisphaerae bacterium GWF2_52_8]|nr:MAG: hypothetical protein A2X49_00650 [Lentisphaerae bacterium GWF2_52_8]
MSTGKIDLHTHSTASDGSLSPSALVSLAGEKGISVIALTDHDTLSGLKEFLLAAESMPSVTAVAGVEISVDMAGSEVHIVGLFVDPDSASLEELLREIRGNRDTRNLQIIARLREQGYMISLEDVLQVAGGESVGRPHFAKILVEKGYFETTKSVFESCLRRGGSAYCSRKLPEPQRAIDAIHKAGGLTFWAHPLATRGGELSSVRKFLKTLIKLGLDGVEAYYTSYTAQQQKAMIELANINELLISGGSDFHGTNQLGVEMGSGMKETLLVPEEVYLKLDEAIKLRKGNRLLDLTASTLA